MPHKVSVVLLDTELKKTRIMLHKVSVVLLDTELKKNEDNAAQSVGGSAGY